MYRYKFHSVINVEDALRNWSDLFWEHHARMRDTTVAAERARFIEAREGGARFIPGAEDCDNFDDLTGCRGHMDGDT